MTTNSTPKDPRPAHPSVHSATCDRNNGPSLCHDCVNDLANYLEGK